MKDNVKLIWLLVGLAIASTQFTIWGGVYVGDWCVWTGLGCFFISVNCLAKVSWP